MALIPCHQCHAPISSMALMCPKCKTQVICQASKEKGHSHKRDQQAIDAKTEKTSTEDGHLKERCAICNGLSHTLDPTYKVRDSLFVKLILAAWIYYFIGISIIESYAQANFREYPIILTLLVGFPLCALLVEFTLVLIEKILMMKFSQPCAFCVDGFRVQHRDYVKEREFNLKDYSELATRVVIGIIIFFLAFDGSGLWLILVIALLFFAYRIKTDKGNIYKFKYIPANTPKGHALPPIDQKDRIYNHLRKHATKHLDMNRARAALKNGTCPMCHYVGHYEYEAVPLPTLLFATAFISFIINTGVYLLTGYNIFLSGFEIIGSGHMLGAEENPALISKLTTGYIIWTALFLMPCSYLLSASLSKGTCPNCDESNMSIQFKSVNFGNILATTLALLLLLSITHTQVRAATLITQTQVNIQHQDFVKAEISIEKLNEIGYDTLALSYALWKSKLDLMAANEKITIIRNKIEDLAHFTTGKGECRLDFETDFVVTSTYLPSEGPQSLTTIDLRDILLLESDYSKTQDSGYLMITAKEGRSFKKSLIRKNQKNTAVDHVSLDVFKVKSHREAILIRALIHQLITILEVSE